jgi:hypothetical protein
MIEFSWVSQVGLTVMGNIHLNTAACPGRLVVN